MTGDCSVIAEFELSIQERNELLRELCANFPPPTALPSSPESKLLWASWIDLVLVKYEQGSASRLLEQQCELMVDYHERMQIAVKAAQAVNSKLSKKEIEAFLRKRSRGRPHGSGDPRLIRAHFDFKLIRAIFKIIYLAAGSSELAIEFASSRNFPRSKDYPFSANDSLREMIGLPGEFPIGLAVAVLPKTASFEAS